MASALSGPKKSNKENFERAARELGCDESEEHFDSALKRVVKHRLPDSPAPKQSKPEKDSPTK